METIKMKVAWRHKNRLVRERGARPLEYRHPDGKTEIASPMLEGEHIVYEVSEAYGRKLLAECSHQFKLLSPMKMTIGFTTKVGAREYRDVHSILTRKGFKGEGVNPEEDDDDFSAPIGAGLGADEEIGLGNPNEPQEPLDPFVGSVPPEVKPVDIVPPPPFVPDPVEDGKKGKK